MNVLLLFFFFYRERFWENLTTPLFGTLTPPSDTTEVLCYIFAITHFVITSYWMSNQLSYCVYPQPCVLETCAFVMKIIGLEIYYVVR